MSELSDLDPLKRLRCERDDAHLVIAALVRRLGGKVELTEAELVAADHEIQVFHDRMNGKMFIDVAATGPLPRLEGDNIIKNWRYKGP